jgi:hypothetical protein
VHPFPFSPYCRTLASCPVTPQECPPPPPFFSRFWWGYIVSNSVLVWWFVSNFFSKQACDQGLASGLLPCCAFVYHLYVWVTVFSQVRQDKFLVFGMHLMLFPYLSVMGLWLCFWSICI